MRPFHNRRSATGAPISTPFIAANEAATSTSDGQRRSLTTITARKCSSICGILRAQNVTDLTRGGFLISPSLMMMVAFGDAISIARVAIGSKLHGTAPRTGSGLDSCGFSRIDFDHLRFGRESSKSPTTDPGEYGLVHQPAHSVC